MKLQTLKHKHQSALEQLSGVLLGAPYESNPLGEGSSGEFCQKPLFRLDAFDCLTFVNTVLAQYHAGDSELEFRFHMARLNYYGAHVRYQNRYHFMSADWNPQNIVNGYLCNLTSSVTDEHGLPLCDYASTLIDRPQWILKRSADDLYFKSTVTPSILKQKLQALHALASTCAVSSVCTAYIPLNRLFNHRGDIETAVWAQLPDYGILEIIRPYWDLREQIGTYIDVSHLGFIFKKQNTYYFRHASSHPSIMCVTEEPLVGYLQGCLHSSTIKGIAILGILAPADASRVT